MMAKPTTVHVSMRLAVVILVGSPAAVIKMIPAITRSMGAKMMAMVNRKFKILLVNPVKEVAFIGFGKTMMTEVAAPLMVKVVVPASPGSL